MGSDGSAAGGGRSDLSEWQRSADAKELRRRRQMLGTATGNCGVATRQIKNHRMAAEQCFSAKILRLRIFDAPLRMTRLWEIVQ